MRNEKKIEVGRSITAIRLHIRRLALALESDRVLIANAQHELDSTLEDLNRQIESLREMFVLTRAQKASSFQGFARPDLTVSLRNSAMRRDLSDWRPPRSISLMKSTM